MHFSGEHDAGVGLRREKGVSGLTLDLLEEVLGGTRLQGEGQRNKGRAEKRDSLQGVQAELVAKQQSLRK